MAFFEYLLPRLLPNYGEGRLGRVVCVRSADMMNTHPDVISLLGQDERNATFFVGEADPDFAIHQKTWKDFTSEPV